MLRTPRAPLLLLAAMLLLPAGAHAAKWIPLPSREAARLEVDAGSRHTVDSGRLRLWFRETHSRPQLPDSGAFSFTRQTTLGEFQCDRRLFAARQRIFSASDGSEVFSERPEGAEMAPVAPDSPPESVLSYACKHVRKPAVAKPAPPPPPPAPAAETAESAKKPVRSTKKGQPEPPPHWNYTGSTGPDKWGTLGKDYATCSQGQRQSPIDIRHSVRADLPPIQFAYKTVALSIVDNGHSIAVDTAEAGGLTVDGERYELLQFHFHKPGEEKINGKAYAMGIHLVHRSKAGKLAVVAIPIEAGKKEHPLIRSLWTHLPLEQGKPITRPEVKIDPTLLLPAKAGYYTFLGSLTTPPCSEGVLWLVLKNPIQVTKEQLADFATLYKNNARPVQPVNNRVIKASR